MGPEPERAHAAGTGWWVPGPGRLRRPAIARCLTAGTVAAMQAAVGALKSVRTLFRGELYIAAALDGQTRKHLEVRPANDWHALDRVHINPIVGVSAEGQACSSAVAAMPRATVTGPLFRTLHVHCRRRLHRRRRHVAVPSRLHGACCNPLIPILPKMWP